MARMMTNFIFRPSQRKLWVRKMNDYDWQIKDECGCEILAGSHFEVLFQHYNIII